MNILAASAWVLGEMYAGVLLWADDPQLKDLDWRRLLILASLPSVVLGTVACCVLPESPHVLAHQGRHAAARKVLARMAALNGRSREAEHALRSVPKLADCSGSSGSSESDTEEEESASDEDEAPNGRELLPPGHHHSRHIRDHSLCDKMSILWGPRLGFTTVVVCFTCCVINFVYYGGVYSFPQILPYLGLSLSPAANLILGAVFELAGNLISVWTMQKFKRKTNFQIGFVSQLLSICIFLHGVCVKSSLSVAEMEVGFVGMKLTIPIIFNVAYVYSTEVYPTAVRASGTAACMSCGRVGAALCPFVYEFVKHRFGGSGAGEEGQGIWPFFVFLAVITVLNAALALCLPFETADKKLTDAELE